MNFKHVVTTLVTASSLAFVGITATSTVANTSVQAATTSTVDLPQTTIYVKNASGAPIYTTPSATGKVGASSNTLQNGSAWATTKAIKAGNVTYYQVGDGQWLSNADISFDAPVVSLNKTMYVNANGGSVNLYSSAKNGYFTGQTVNDADAYPVYESTTDGNGQTWYNLGNNQWINGQYMSDEKPAAKISMSATAYDPAVLGSSMGYSGVAANLSRYPKGTQLKITLSDGTVLNRTVNDTGTFAYSNPNQLDIAMPNSQALQFGRQNITVQVVG
ncbi:SLAP domain-containing protein [Companilactobacillus sp.]|jgi:3D (Asp-Asp-Asp) domain-containing protein|uniref:SLAP domain-containing protein n=1 Tax=Companilactobacillus sp. TaxID=2767905 RepID=UPI0025BA1344|nr:hypothetical protein [Companilactobacillus sp.]MCH4008890.1 hypothetical protein [Companilactobacillus sp.]MCH4050931.1 hypothetical protein [Companilactobacillus sp.]MCH4076833.1 hypothetical protein [Companilactobacillus sp.]MCH4125408.1 hypothetical protein [Companilactobacillus sp.]MCH4131950.1 hypothetical protein [Companilactobacillus sp.]